MRFALRDLDTGLFFDKGQWAIDPRFAQQFDDAKEVEKLVIDYGIRNAEAVVLEGNPPQVTGGFPIRISN